MASVLQNDLKNISGSDALLLISAYANPTKPLNRISFQKITYLLKQKYGVAEDSKFEEEDYGVYDRDLNESLSWMIASNLIGRDSQASPSGIGKLYFLNKGAAHKLDEVTNKMSYEEFTKIRRDVLKLSSYDFDTLVALANLYEETKDRNLLDQLTK